MPALWRLYRAQHGPGLDGVGGMFSDGRWHSRGERITYFGSTAAIVVLERLAHTDPDLLPVDLRLGYFEFSDAAIQAETIPTLPEGWIWQENLTRLTGDRWRRQGSFCLLSVPSAILPEESNYVFNPLHPDAKHLRLIRERPFQFDSRLI
jgi:RES domain-containing protein